MQKADLTAPLPTESETDAYLYRELGVAPGTEISLSLNEQLRSSNTIVTSGRSPWRSTRVACLLAIRGSEHQALTTKELFQALIKAVPFCDENSHLTSDPPTGTKRKGWPVRTSYLSRVLCKSFIFLQASVVSVLSKHTIFVQKTPEGRSCKEWRLDVRGEKYQTGSCSHSRGSA